MKVCLIQPKAPRRPMDTELKARMSPHLGLLTISGLLERAGHEVRVVNGNVGPVEIPEGTDLVGISVTVDVLPAARISRRRPFATPCRPSAFTGTSSPRAGDVRSPAISATTARPR